MPTAVDSRSGTEPGDGREVSVRILLRLEASGGQGVVGVVAVIGLFSATLAVGLLGYIGFQDRKADKQAQANLLSAVQMALVYRANHGSYAGMDTVDLRKIDPRLSTTLTVASAQRGSYCLADNVHGRAWSIAGSGPYKANARFTANATCT